MTIADQKRIASAVRAIQRELGPKMLADVLQGCPRDIKRMRTVREVIAEREARRNTDEVREREAIYAVMTPFEEGRPE